MPLITKVTVSPVEISPPVAVPVTEMVLVASEASITSSEVIASTVTVPASAVVSKVKESVTAEELPEESVTRALTLIVPSARLLMSVAPVLQSEPEFVALTVIWFAPSE